MQKVNVANLHPGNFHETADFAIPRMGISSVKIGGKSYSAITVHALPLIENGVMEFIPLQLNEEWLKAFGFIDSKINLPSLGPFQQRSLRLLQKEDSAIYFVLLGDESSEVFIKEIQFVHELQNIYKEIASEDLWLVSEKNQKEGWISVKEKMPDFIDFDDVRGGEKTTDMVEVKFNDGTLGQGLFRDNPWRSSWMTREGNTGFLANQAWGNKHVEFWRPFKK